MQDIEDEILRLLSAEGDILESKVGCFCSWRAMQHSLCFIVQVSMQLASRVLGLAFQELIDTLEYSKKTSAVINKAGAADVGAVCCVGLCLWPVSVRGWKDSLSYRNCTASGNGGGKSH